MFSFLDNDDCGRVTRVLQKFAECRFQMFALTGGIAIAQHCGDCKRMRLNDLDVVVEDAEALPTALGDAFLVRHFHPEVRRGRILIQLVDAVERLRIDVFTALGRSFERAYALPNGLAIVSKEDLTARLASILMDIDRGRPVDPKYLLAFEQIATRVDEAAMPIAWSDQRKDDDPATFAEAARRLQCAALAHPELLRKTVYTTTPDLACADCVRERRFKCAPADVFLPILGYC